MDPEKVNYHYCDDLPTSPLPGVGTVLVSGANGYVAKRLVPELLFRGYRVRCMLRKKLLAPILSHPNLEYVYADALDPEQLRPALEGVDVAYYLIHSMRMIRSRFRQVDKELALNFRQSAEAAGVKKIIYLGGLGETAKNLSRHLQSRIEVGSILSDGPIPVIRLRCAIIIGTGSASYELLKSMIQHMSWIPFLPEFNSQCQPIAIRDVIKYLVGVLETEGLTTRKYPIGGPDVMTYRQLVQRFANVLNKRIRFLTVSWVPLPISLMCRIFAYWLHLFISVEVNLIYLLLESLKTDVVCPDRGIREILPFETVGFETAVKWALQKEVNAMVYSHWSDVPPENMIDFMPLAEFESSSFIVEEHSKDIPAEAEAVFQ
ncbi:MAG: NAD(P)H-binding protein, partial [Nitrospinaceae bacterium]|nr:NAD(P)H-binding protein [Nitrospinaceae bacterium]NIR55801.1 NAD(P)H-binding protein [Nitrospinaceae bacterium]NIS86254.1 NAD(P)H-binding protein [Nitrospinaceae bacterium]NIT83083.1 NAD(P)H-binding protein [Nitrospinaceae bacterium]NIU45293.1 NAD(P)H-binding protein [Nitrospinaceae bacterium]